MLIQDVSRCKLCRHSRAPREKRGIIPAKPFAAGILFLLAFHLSMVSEIPALEATNQSEQNPQGETPEVDQKLGKEWSEYADLAGTYNPPGIDISGGG